MSVYSEILVRNFNKSFNVMAKSSADPTTLTISDWIMGVLFLSLNNINLS